MSKENNTSKMVTLTIGELTLEWEDGDNTAYQKNIALGQIHLSLATTKEGKIRLGSKILNYDLSDHEDYPVREAGDSDEDLNEKLYSFYCDILRSIKENSNPL